MKTKPIVLVLIRGLPGAGKSFLARALSRTYDLSWFEADMFRYTDKGKYVFDPKDSALCSGRIEL